MTSRLNLRWVLTILVVAISMAALFALQTVRAQEADQVTLLMSPQLIELSANPGDEPLVNMIRITNGGDFPVELKTTPQNIVPTGEEGGSVPTEDDTSYSLADWITVEPSLINLPPGETQDFTVTIAVPAIAEPGGHYGTVTFETVPPENNTGGAAASVSQRLAPVILVSVAGDISESGEIASFESTKSFWTNEKPITLETRISNSGNVHFKPTGTITIKNMFGAEVTKIVLEEKNVLPDTVRKIETEWSDPGFAVGRYTADLSLVYGEGDTILVSSTTFTVFPWQTLLPVGLIVVAVLYLLIKFRSRVGTAFKVLAGKN